MGYLKSTPYEILSRRRGRTHRNTPHEGKGARRERPNWGLALLMRPAKAAPAVPFANFAAMPTPERVSAIIAAFLARWYHANPPCLTYNKTFSDWAWLLSRFLRPHRMWNTQMR